jgi:hypothetical protein
MILNNKENEEPFQDALARICRCIGGNGTKSESADSDFEVVDDYVTINLHCPVSSYKFKRLHGEALLTDLICVHLGSSGSVLIVALVG